MLVGLTIYLKTSIDFALLIRILMAKFPGLKNRIALEIGTSVGNAIGTMLVLFLWVVFRNVPWLLASMVILASLVLFKLAQTSLDHIDDDSGEAGSAALNPVIANIKSILEKFITPINKVFAPVLDKTIPDLHFDSKKI